MMEMLDALYRKLQRCVEHPLSGIASFVFVLVWFIASLHKLFDPDMTIGSFVENAIQLILLFVIGYTSAKHIKRTAAHHVAVESHHREMRAHAERVEAHLDTLKTTMLDKTRRSAP